MRVYMEISRDIYELPLIVTETSRELANLCNTTVDNIHSCMSKAKKNGHRCRFVAVDIDDEED